MADEKKSATPAATPPAEAKENAVVPKAEALKPSDREAVQLPLTRGKPSESDIAMAKAILAAAGESEAPKLLSADEVAAADDHKEMDFVALETCYTPNGTLIEKGGTFRTNTAGYANAVTGKFVMPKYLKAAPKAKAEEAE